ncbi:MAG: hypothetical protein H7841_06910 [Magnetospirillum sp. WYHS-4]
MRVGIDFDNTLAGYDAVFRDEAVALGLLPPGFAGGKTEVKAALSDSDWQRLQGQAYGRLMPRADLIAGADHFLIRCRRKGARVFVVSHKTRFGHFDPARVDLRAAARAWMEAKGFFSVLDVDRDDVFFEETREAKIARIAALRLDHFVDDLKEVLDDPGFPPGPRRHWFTGDWPAIEREVFADAA